MPLVLEGLVTTLDADDAVHLAPMGPHVEPDLMRFTLRPYDTSHTGRNLRDRREGVFHITDDSLLLAKAAVGAAADLPRTEPAIKIRGRVLSSACRALEFRVTTFDDREQRWKIDCEVVHVHRLRDFFGFNRAKHAVVEAAILATRVHWLSRGDIRAELRRLRPLVDKTGGPPEFEAFEFIWQYIESTPEVRP